MDIRLVGRAGLAVLLALALAAGGCNTVKGVGRDTEKAGEAIQRGAERHDFHPNDGT